jgi:hypothetical protein
MNALDLGNIEVAVRERKLAEGILLDPRDPMAVARGPISGPFVF